MIQVFGSTDCGNVRKQNQDSFVYDIINENTAYAIVCDGMGGENAGDIASTMACKILEQHLSRNIRVGLSEITVRNIIQTALQDANLQIYQKSVSDESYKGMGTTVVMVVVMGSKVYFSSIGDSRIYVGNDTEAIQLTTDHTVVQFLLARGEITPEEAETHPQKHFVTKALGVSCVPDYDYDLYEGFGKDMWILLCSDGLSNYITPPQLPKLLYNVLTADSTQNLMEYAKAQGGRDNITAVVIAWR